MISTYKILDETDSTTSYTNEYIISSFRNFSGITIEIDQKHHWNKYQMLSMTWFMIAKGAKLILRGEFFNIIMLAITVLVK